MTKRYNIPIFIPHEGCPNDCVFCNQKKITGLETSVTPSMAAQVIEKHLDFLPDDAVIEAAFFGGSFTGLSLEKQEAFLQTAAAYHGRIAGIRMSTRPDYISDDVLVLAKRYGVTMIELGLQSADDRVLQLNGRGHGFVDTKLAVEKIRAYGIGVGLQMMLGMYGSTPEKDMQTATCVIGLSPDCVRIYPTVVLKDTRLEALYRSGEYTPYTLEQAVGITADILQCMRNLKIPVIRMGLHASEELQSTGDLVAGPFHPAFGELVESRLWRRKIEKEILEKGITKGELIIAVRPDEVSKVVGHRKINRQYFYEKYGIILRCIQEQK